MNGSLIMWAVVVLILALVIAAFGYIFYRVFGTGEPLPPVEHRDVIANNEKAIAEGRLQDIRFELAPRGYRQDQVDAALMAIYKSGEQDNSTSQVTGIPTGSEPDPAVQGRI